MKRKSLQQCLKQNVKNFPTQTIYRYVESETAIPQELTFFQLYHNAKKIAAFLQKNGKKGDRVLLLFPPGLDFCNAIWACLISGFVAVPIPLSANINSIKDYLNHIQNDCDADFLLINNALKPILEYQKQLDENISLPTTIAATDELLKQEIEFNESEILENEIAVLQYTSGSISKPKGVILSHKNIVENILAINRISGVFEMKQGVTWLPHFHDMGLIGTFLLAVISTKPGTLTFLSPLTFIEKPLLWLKLMSKLKGEISVAPNFAFELCTKAIKDEDLQGLDLSNWQIAICGSETINSKVIAAFIKKFEKFGFKKSAIVPSYGLAEATLLVSTKAKGENYKTLKLNKKALENNKIEIEKNKLDFKEIVSCGVVEKVSSVKILSENKVLNEGSDDLKIGEIYVAGNSVSTGYYNKKLEANKNFNYKFEGSELNYFRTGDLGFFYKKELFVTGRIKEIIIIRGKNYYPYDIENEIYNVNEHIRKGNVAAFSYNNNSEEKLAIVCELKRKSENVDFEKLIIDIKKIVSLKFGIAASLIYIIKTNTLPKTTSGKIQRQKIKKLLKANALKTIYKFEVSNNISEIFDETEIVDLIKLEIENITSLKLDNIDENTSLFDLGIESVHLPKLLSIVKQKTNKNIIIENWILQPTINNFIKQLHLAEDEKQALKNAIKINKEQIEKDGVNDRDFVMPDFSILEE